jgi:hypothetical protein
VFDVETGRSRCVSRGFCDVFLQLQVRQRYNTPASITSASNTTAHAPHGLLELLFARISHATESFMFVLLLSVLVLCHVFSSALLQVAFFPYSDISQTPPHLLNSLFRSLLSFSYL